MEPFLILIFTNIFYKIKISKLGFAAPWKWEQEYDLLNSMLNLFLFK